LLIVLLVVNCVVIVNCVVSC